MQTKTLEALEEWTQTICRTAPYKEDLGFIRDMHTLLSCNGYVFPRIKNEDAAVLNQTEVGKFRNGLSLELTEILDTQICRRIREGGRGISEDQAPRAIAARRPGKFTRGESINEDIGGL